MRLFRRSAGSGIALSLAVLLTACGSGGASGSDSGGDATFRYTGADRTAYLENCAAGEDGFTWYTSLAGDIVDAMVGGFAEQYPNIKAEVFRGEQTDIVSRVVQESQADRLQGDVVEVTSDGFRVLADQDVLAPFTSPLTANYDQRFQLTNDDGELLGIGDRASYVGFAYNTNALPPDAVPHQWEDLLKPELKGKLAITSSTTGVRFAGNAFQRFGPEQGDQFLRQLADQDVRVEAISGSALAGLIGTGEVAASPGIFRNHAQQLQAQGAPVEWVPLEPVTANVGYAGVFASSDSPCSATLFLDFLLGDRGTQIYQDLRYPRPTEDLGFTSWVPDETFDSTDDYNKAYEHWSDTFDELFVR